MEPVSLARPERFELPTFWFVARRSIQLSYGRAVCAPDAFVGRGVPEILAWPVGGWKLEVGAHREQSRGEILGPIKSSIGWLGTTRRIELPWFGSEKKKTP